MRTSEDSATILPMEVIFLGTGTSHGIPVVSCTCEVCTSADPRDQRSRASILIKEKGSSVLIDTSTEFRLQAVREGIREISAILFTHAHADHLHGLDDIRPLTIQHAVHAFASPDTAADIRKRFDYIFKHTQIGGGKPNLILSEITGPEFIAAGLKITPVPLKHGTMHIFGYRIGKLAYLTDCSCIPKESYALLEDLDVLILGALRYKPHPTHFCFDQAIEAAEKIGARRTFFTHLCHDASHEELLKYLPKKIEPAYDGLYLDVRV